MNEGNFKARAIAVDFGFTSSGTEKIAVMFEILDGPCQGDTITWYGYFTEKTQERTIVALRTMGWQGVNLSTLTDLDLQNEVYLVVRTEQDFAGKERFRVVFINAKNGGLQLKNKMSDQQKLEFARRMHGTCMHIKPQAALSLPSAPQTAQKRPQQQNPPQPQRQAVHDDIPPDFLEGDDVPF